jgi:hypothetical protein
MLLESKMESKAFCQKTIGPQEYIMYLKNIDSINYTEGAISPKVFCPKISAILANSAIMAHYLH